MESSTAAQSQTGPHARAEYVEEATRASRARRRGAVLARMLYFGDSLAACIAAAFAITILGLTSFEGVGFAVCTTLLWPFAAFSIGLYRSRPALRLGLGRHRDPARLRRRAC